MIENSPGGLSGRFGGLSWLKRLVQKPASPAAAAAHPPAPGGAAPLVGGIEAGAAVSKHSHPPVAALGASFSEAPPDVVRLELRELARHDPSVAQVVSCFQQLAQSKGQIVVGPWLSEVGYEVLYWIPFLRWAVQEFNIDPKRLTIVSRGGVDLWYAGITRKYVDIFDLFTPDEFRELNEQRWKETSLQKHMIVSNFDLAVLRKLGFGSVRRMIHPELMYKLFDPYWSGQAGFDRFRDFTQFKPLAKPKPTFLQELPKDYVAVKFYSRPSMPSNDHAKEFVEWFTPALAEQMPVVFLNTQINADDHGEFTVPNHPNIYTIERWLTPNNNLAVQSAIVANAQRVYCTYGGFSYLPLLYGVPVCGFYSTDKHFMKIHGRAAYMMANLMKTPLSVCETGWLAALASGGRQGPEVDAITRPAASSPPALKVG